MTSYAYHGSDFKYCTAGAISWVNKSNPQHWRRHLSKPWGFYPWRRCRLPLNELFCCRKNIKRHCTHTHTHTEYSYTGIVKVSKTVNAPWTELHSAQLNYQQTCLARLEQPIFPWPPYRRIFIVIWENLEINAGPPTASIACVVLYFFTLFVKTQQMDQCIKQKPMFSSWKRSASRLTYSFKDISKWYLKIERVGLDSQLVEPGRDSPAFTQLGYRFAALWLLQARKQIQRTASENFLLKPA